MQNIFRVLSKHINDKLLELVMIRSFGNLTKPWCCDDGANQLIGRLALVCTLWWRLLAPEHARVGLPCLLRWINVSPRSPVAGQLSLSRGWSSCRQWCECAVLRWGCEDALVAGFHEICSRFQPQSLSKLLVEHLSDTQLENRSAPASSERGEGQRARGPPPPLDSSRLLDKLYRLRHGEA